MRHPLFLFLTGAALASFAQTTEVSSDPPASAGPPPAVRVQRSEAEGGIPMLSEAQTDQFNRQQSAAHVACGKNEAACYAECNRPNEEACALLIGIWVTGAFGKDPALRKPDKARALVKLVCEKASARTCARQGVLLWMLSREHPEAAPMAGETLGAACARGFAAACEWKTRDSGRALPAQIEDWGRAERPFSTDPLLANCDEPIVAARLVKRKDPDYPDTLRRRGVQGRVFLELTIDESGQPHDVTVTRSDDAGFDSASIKAVGGWRYSPALSCGVPVRSRKQATVIFMLGH